MANADAIAQLRAEYREAVLSDNPQARVRRAEQLRLEDANA